MIRETDSNTEKCVMTVHLHQQHIENGFKVNCVLTTTKWLIFSFRNIVTNLHTSINMYMYTPSVCTCVHFIRLYMRMYVMRPVNIRMYLIYPSVCICGSTWIVTNIKASSMFTSFVDRGYSLCIQHIKLLNRRFSISAVKIWYLHKNIKYMIRFSRVIQWWKFERMLFYVVVQYRSSNECPDIWGILFSNNSTLYLL